MGVYHTVTGVRFEDQLLVAEIDGEERCFPVSEISSRLALASEEERSVFEVSPSGYGIHWPLLDEDLSIDGLLGIAHSPEFARKSA